MDIEALKEFCVLAETESFSHAAARLSQSQPVLTRHIQKLEKDLGRPLFDRTTRKVVLNDAGRRFLPYVRTMLDAYQDYLRVEADEEEAELTVRIGLTDKFSTSSIHDSMFRCAAEKGLNLEYSSGSEEEMFALLAGGKLDLVAAYEQPPGRADDFVRTCYFRDELAAVLPVNHPLAGSSVVFLKAFAEEKFIFLDRSHAVGALAAHCCENAGFEPKVVHVSRFEDNILELVRKNVGISILLKNPKNVIGAVVLDMTPTITVDLNLIWRKDARPRVKEFVEALGTHFAG